MSDFAHEKTDKLLIKLEKEIEAVYKKSIKEMNEKMKKLIVKIDLEQDPTKLYNMLLKQKRFEALLKDMTLMLNNSNKIAVELMNNSLIDVYSLNSNYIAFNIEKIANFDMNWTVYNKQTIKSILQNEANPFEMLAVNNLKDKNVIFQALRRELMISIMQGESIPEIAKRVAKVGGSKYNDMVRIARTEITRVQNHARLDVMNKASDKGLNIVKMWISTPDSRTRISHRDLDGEERKLNDTFSNGLLFPGDSSGSASEVISCRCTMTTEFPGLEKSDKEKALDKRLNEKSYEVWKNGK